MILQVVTWHKTSNYNIINNFTKGDPMESTTYPMVSLRMEGNCMKRKNEHEENSR